MQARPSPVKRNEIHISTQSEQYYSGDILSGYVDLVIVQPTVAQNLVVSLIGRETTDFTNKCKEVNTFLRNNKQLRLPSVEDYSRGGKVIPSGKHKIAFSFALPNYLPPTFIHANKTASVEYKVVAALRPAGWDQNSTTSSSTLLSELEAEAPVNIGGTLFDADYVENIQDNANYVEDSKIYPGTEDPINVSASVDTKVLKPNTPVTVAVKVRNEGEEKVTSVVAKLIQHVEFFSMEKKLLDEDLEIGYASIGAVPSRCELESSVQLFAPPNVVESIIQRAAGNSTLGKLIRVSYSVDVMVEVNRPFMRLHIPVLVVRKYPQPTPMMSPSKQKAYNYLDASGVFQDPEESTPASASRQPYMRGSPQASPARSYAGSPRVTGSPRVPSSPRVTSSPRAPVAPVAVPSSPRANVVVPEHRSPAYVPQASMNESSPARKSTPSKYQKGTTPVHEALYLESPNREKAAPAKPQNSPTHSPSFRNGAEAPRLNNSPVRSKYMYLQQQQQQQQEEEEEMIDEEQNIYQLSPSKRSHAEIEAELSATKKKLRAINDIIQTSPPKGSPSRSPAPQRVQSSPAPAQQSPRAVTSSPRPSLLAQISKSPSRISAAGLNGHATYTWEDGSQYTGYWLNGKKHGEGRMTYAEGSVYNGQFYNDIRHGMGTYQTDDYTYEGHWTNDAMHGQGRIAYKSGEVLEGFFVNGQLQN